MPRVFVNAGPSLAGIGLMGVEASHDYLLSTILCTLLHFRLPGGACYPCELFDLKSALLPCSFPFWPIGSQGRRPNRFCPQEVY